MSITISPDEQKTASDELPVPAEMVRAQVKRILASGEFEKSARLKDFLNYVVEETLSGRSAYLKGRTIAQAVFAADDDFDPEANSIVRVEAGRLRRRLGQYYSTVGSQDPIVIYIPKGTYAAEFSQNRVPGPQEAQALAGRWSKSRFKSHWALMSGIAVIAVLMLTWYLFGNLNPADRLATAGISNTSRSQHSEAEILLRQALIVLMPPENRARLTTSYELFQNVIDSEPGFAGGYAGKSVAYSVAVLFMKSGNPESDLHQASTLAERSIELDPDYSLGYAALALARSLDAKPVLALESARRSVASVNRQPIADVMVSLALLNSDSPQEAIDLLSESLKLVVDEPRTPHLNVLGIAYYVTGDYAEAARNFEKNMVRNGPTGPHMDIFRAATHARLGNDFQARGILEKLQQTYSDYPIEPWLANFIKSKDDLQATLQLLWESGLAKQ